MDPADLLNNPLAMFFATVILAPLLWRFIKKGDQVAIEKLTDMEFFRKNPEAAKFVGTINDTVMELVAVAYDTVVKDAKESGKWTKELAEKTKGDVITSVEARLKEKIEAQVAAAAAELGNSDKVKELLAKHMSDQVEEAVKSLKEVIRAGGDPKAAIAAAHANLAAATLQPATPPARPLTEAELKDIADRATAAANAGQKGEASGAGAIAAGLLMLAFVGGFVMGCTTMKAPKGCVVNGQAVCCDPDTLNRLATAAERAQADGGAP